MNATNPTPPQSDRCRERGITLIETIMSASAVALIIGGAMALMLSSRSSFAMGETKSSLQEVGRRTLNNVLVDLRRSGLTQSDGQNYPAIWERPPALAEDSVRGNLIATMNYEDVDQVDETLAYAGDGNRITRNADRVANEFVFQVPGDVDGNGIPLDADGALEWLPEVFSYRIEVSENGVPWLMKITELNGAVVSRERIGPWIRKITFDVVFNDRSMRFGTIAVVVYLERINNKGQTITSALEGSVVLRNTQEL